MKNELKVYLKLTSIVDSNLKHYNIDCSGKLKLLYIGLLVIHPYAFYIMNIMFIFLKCTKKITIGMKSYKLKRWKKAIDSSEIW